MHVAFFLVASRLLQSYEGQIWTYAPKTAYVASENMYVALRPAQRQRAAIEDSLIGLFVCLVTQA